MDDFYFKEILKWCEVYEVLFSECYIINKIQCVILQMLSVEDGEEKMMVDVEVKFKVVFLENLGLIFVNFKMNYYSINNLDVFLQVVVDYFRDYFFEDVNELNFIVWFFYESVEDKKMLKEVVKWAECFVEIEFIFYNNDIFVVLYYKLGNKKVAKVVVKKVIELVKVSGEDYIEIKELFEKIECL